MDVIKPEILHRVTAIIKLCEGEPCYLVPVQIRGVYL